MSNTQHRHEERQQARRHTRQLTVVAAIVILGLAGFAIARSTGGGSTHPAEAASSETNAMGMRVIATPGVATGTATVHGITGEPAKWALGRVALNVAVRPSWTITNTSADTVTVGEPHVQINQGCCPGALTIQGLNTLAPGASTGIVFELSMHPGMDGAHDMTVHVPIARSDGTTDTLDLTVTGDFRD
jgi:hypothetical protein